MEHNTESEARSAPAVGLFTWNINHPRQAVTWSQCFDRWWNGHLEPREAYLSAACFGPEISEYIEQHGGSTAGFNGEHGLPYLVIDIDRPGDVELARADAMKLVRVLTEQMGIKSEQCLINFSGSKGFHVRVPASAFASTSSAADFAARCGRLAQELAELAQVAIDARIYDTLRMLRLPNSRHPESGLIAVPLRIEELHDMDADAILKLAEQPRSWPLPTEAHPWSEKLAAMWLSARSTASSSPSPSSRDRTDPRLFTPRREGERNNAAFDLARYLRDHAVPEGIARQLLRYWNRCNRPPLPDRDLLATIASAYSRQPYSKEVKTQSLADTAAGLWRSLKEQLSPERTLKTGLLDAAFRPYPGLPRCSMTVLLAPPKLGKTTLAMQLALEVIRRNAKARGLVYTAEMSPMLLTAKLVAAISNTSLNEIVTAAAEGASLPDACRPAITELAELGSRLTYMPGPATVRTLAHVAHRVTPDLIVVDYLQRLFPARLSRSRKQDIDLVLTRLTQMKHRHDAALIVVSSESRGEPGDPYRRNRGVGAAKESGDIEYEADLLWRLQLSADHHRREREGERLSVVEVELKCLASRLTEPRDFLLYFDRERQCFLGDEPGG